MLLQATQGVLLFAGLKYSILSASISPSRPLISIPSKTHAPRFVKCARRTSQGSQVS
jgi:hypothetical protein